jgi:hypothetical protein
MRGNEKTEKNRVEFGVCARLDLKPLTASVCNDIDANSAPGGSFQVSSFERSREVRSAPLEPER